MEKNYILLKVIMRLNMIEDLNIKNIEKIVSEYDVKYTICDGYGKINYNTKEIHINPCYDSICDRYTLSHMIVHHIFNENWLDIPEQETEKYSQELMQNKQINQYLGQVKIDKSCLNCAYETIPIYELGCKRK